MNILVTGGNGFVGQHLVKELSKKKKSNILVLCRKKHEKTYYDLEKLNNVQIVYGTDICDYKNIEKHFKEKDIVFHLAGLVSFCQKDRINLRKINHSGTLNVLKACEENNVKKLMYLSSTAALGFNSSILTEETCFDWSKYKRCVYSHSKAMPEKRLLQSKMSVVIIHPPMIFGPGDYKVLKLLKPMKNGGIPLVTEGRNSVIDVRDLVQALLILMKDHMKKGRYIVCSENFSFYELNSIIAEHFNVSKPRVIIPKWVSPMLQMFALICETFRINLPLTYENVFLSFKDRIHEKNKIAKLGFKTRYPFRKSLEDTAAYLASEGEL